MNPRSIAADASRRGGIEAAIAELERRARDQPADRYPIQHATAQFHLGLALTDAGRLHEAEAVLRSCARIFGDANLVAERAKAENALGSVLRAEGRAREAEDAFAHAIAGFEAAGLRLELGAANFNRGLVQRERGELDGALRSFEHASKLLPADSVPAQAAAASRELGTTRMLVGDPESATRALTRSVELARTVDQPEVIGAAANALGLAELAAGREQEAIEAFETALAAHPRAVREERYAMTKANLAVAYERSADSPRARLAAAQARSVAAAPDAVRAQASAVLDRLGYGGGDLVRVLERESRQRWEAVLREELESWPAREPEERRRAALGWIEEVAGHANAPELTGAWLGALLELPPAQMETVVEAAIEALIDAQGDMAEDFRAIVARSTMAFHDPQATRLQRTFEAVAAERGGPTGWG